MKRVQMRSLVLAMIVSGAVALSGCQAQKPPQQAEAPPTPTQAVTEAAPSPTAEVVQPQATPQPQAGYAQNRVIAAAPTDVKAYTDFFAVANPAFIIPGLEADLVPQGLCYIQDEKIVVISYYRESKQASILSLVDQQSGELIKTVELSNEDGTAYTGHAGGLAASKKNLWVCTGGNAQRLPIADLMAAEDGATVQFVDRFATGTRASLSNLVDGVLWAGDFFTSGGNYNTDPSHHMSAPDGTKHYAWVVGYELDSNAENELKAESIMDGSVAVTPDYVLSIPSRIQGLTRLNTGEFVLSESYGRKNDSNVLIYRDVLQSDPDTTVEINGIDVPLWFLDSGALVRSITAPPMSEGIENVDGSIYLLFESGAEAYRDSAKNPVDDVYRLTLD